MKTNLFKIAVVITAVILATTSCKKEEREDLKQSAADNALAEAAFNDIHLQVDKAYEEASATTKSILTGCPTISFFRSDSTNADTIIVDFGTGCTDAYGITRSGRIVSTFTGRYRDAGTVITNTLDNFYRNGNLIQGTKTVTNTGADNDGNIIFDVQVSNASITTDNGTISWNSTRTRKWIQGYNTTWPILSDDVYLISGTASGTNAQGNDFDVAITNDLRIELSCRWIVSGTLELTPEGGDARTLDYGSGDCDDQATLTYKNKTYNITLR